MRQETNQNEMSCNHPFFRVTVDRTRDGLFFFGRCTVCGVVGSHSTVDGSDALVRFEREHGTK